jgi:hypothetical protein
MRIVMISVYFNILSEYVLGFDRLEHNFCYLIVA